MRTWRGCCGRKLPASNEEQPSTKRSSGCEASIYGSQTSTRPNPGPGSGRVATGPRSNHMNLNIDDRLIYFAAGCGLGLALGANLRTAVGTGNAPQPDRQSG